MSYLSEYGPNSSFTKERYYLRQRIQRAAKKGKPMSEIAKQVGVNVKTVLRYVSGPKFAKQLARYRQEQAVEDIALAGRMKALVRTQVQQMEADPNLKLDVLGIAKLNKAALDREDRADHVLSADIQKGLEADDVDLQAAKEVLKARKLAKQAVVTQLKAQRLLEGQHEAES